MSAAQIVLVVFGAIFLGGLIFIFVYPNVRKVPEGITPLNTRNPFVKAHNWIFGSRKATHFEHPLEAMYYSPHKWLIDVFFGLIILFAVCYMGADLKIFSQIRGTSAWEYFGIRIKNMFSPDWSYFIGTGEYKFTEGVLYQLLQTFGIAFVATLLASILALPFGLLASHKLCGKKAVVSEVFLILIRTIPEILLAVVMVGLSGMKPMTGVIALGIHSVGMVGKLYSEQIDDIDFVPLEAIESVGGSTAQKITNGVMPQFTPGMISVAIYRFDINLRTSAILGMVVGSDCGIGFSLSNHSKGNLDHLLGADILGIVVLIIVVDLISSAIRKKLV